MNKILKDKLNNLEEYIRSTGNLAIAFSGGVDSSFLLRVAHKILKDKVTAFTIDTVYIPKREIEEARAFTREHKINHEVITVPLIDIIKHNPSDRCYFCKTFIFKKLINEAKNIGIDNVAEGTNADDVISHRPGMKALSELNILSPLKELNFTKSDIRELSKSLNLPTWDKPAYACLLTRLPYGSEINPKELELIEKSENYLIKKGFNGARVRSHGNLARIEVMQEQLDKLLKKDFLKEVSGKLKSFGYQFVTIDTEGYKQGSFDHVK